MDGLPLDHVAIAVPSIEEARPIFEGLSGTRCSPIEEVEGQGVRVVFVGPVELLEPSGPDSPVGRFLRKRGPGLHHVAYRTGDLARELRRLEEAGFETIDAGPRTGARGHLVAFLHPRSTAGVLVELVEHRD